VSRTEKYLNSIDWHLLAQQKTTLLGEVQKRAKALEGTDTIDPVLEHLDGILYLLDSLQDFAADEYGLTTYFPRCDVCGKFDEEVPWCGNCGNCREHCQHDEGCPA
jgi:hypothetical protein